MEKLTEEQQAFVDELVGKARTKEREHFESQAVKDKEEAAQATLEAEKKWKELAEMHQARVKELEPFETRAKKYDELVLDMLKKKIEAFGEAAKKAMNALPKSMPTVDKLAWLDKNEELFQVAGDGVGTPGRSRGPRRQEDIPF